MLYLFIGEGPGLKDVKLNEVKREFLSPRLQEFNLDKLYAKDLALKDLQQKLLYIPVKSPARIVVIRQAENLNDSLKEFILKFVKTPSKQIVLILDIDKPAEAREFITHLGKYAKVFRFNQTQAPDTFNLSRQITLRRTDYALRILNQLLKDGERPERILGGLRYSLEKSGLPSLETKRRMRLLLACDIDIKTGRLKPFFALEKLLISLCGSGKPSG